MQTARRGRIAQGECSNDGKCGASWLPSLKGQRPERRALVQAQFLFMASVQIYMESARASDALSRKMKHENHSVSSPCEHNPLRSWCDGKPERVSRAVARRSARTGRPIKSAGTA